MIAMSQPWTCPASGVPRWRSRRGRACRRDPQRAAGPGRAQPRCSRWAVVRAARAAPHLRHPNSSARRRPGPGRGPGRARRPGHPARLHPNPTTPTANTPWPSHHRRL